MKLVFSTGKDMWAARRILLDLDSLPAGIRATMEILYDQKPALIIEGEETNFPPNIIAQLRNLQGLTPKLPQVVEIKANAA